MDIVKITFLAGLILLSHHAFSQDSKQKIYKCNSALWADEHTTDAKFNSLIDKACEEINQQRYLDGLRLLNEAIGIDSLSSGTVNEYFRVQRSKLERFIEEMNSSEPARVTEAPTTVESPKSPDDGIGGNEPVPVDGNSNADTAGKIEQVKPEAMEVKAPGHDPFAEQEVRSEPVSTSEAKPFTQEEIEEFQLKGLQKIKMLEEYIQRITDKYTVQSSVDDAIESAVLLFDSEERTVEVSSVNNPAKSRLIVRKYLQKLRMLPYDNIQIVWAEFQYTSDFKMGPDGNYYGYIIFRQRFTATKDAQVAYEDMTTKKTQVILKRYSKNIEGQAVENWDVFLGDISVQQTERN